MGELVWSNFPERERPIVPGPRHFGYVLHVGSLGADAYSAVLAYTTTSGLDITGQLPRGLKAFDATEAEAFGHPQAFRLDLKRLAHVPITAAWFPDLDLPKKGIEGRMPKKLRISLQAELDDLLVKHKDLMGRLGPLWR